MSSKEGESQEEIQDEANAESKETTDNESNVEDKKSEVDYAAELKKLREEKSKLEKINKQTAGALKEERERRKKAEAAGAERTEEDVSLRNDGSNVRDIIKEELSAIERNRVLDDIDDVIESMSESGDERELIKEIYETRINPSGYTKKAIVRDVLDAKLIANRSKFISNAEKKARKSFAQKAALEGARIRTVGEVADTDEPEFNKEEQSFLKKFGIDPKKVKQR